MFLREKSRAPAASLVEALKTRAVASEISKPWISVFLLNLLKRFMAPY
jgi:hypothetical protein